jgi:hypothetical protein
MSDFQTPPPGGNVYSQAAGGIQQAGQGYADMAAPGAFLGSMNSFINPYREQVVGNTMRQLGTQQDANLNQVRGQAAQAGAFGGARHGLVEAEVMKNYQQTAGDTVGALYDQGFQQSGSMANMAGSQRFNALGGMSNTGQVGWGLGDAVTGNQAAAGQQQQGVAQGVLNQGNQQFQQYAQRPQQTLSQILSALSGNPLGQTGSTTASSTPGTFDYLSLGAGLGSSYLGKG